MKVAVYVDGGAWPNPGPAAVGAVVVSEHGEVIADQCFSIGEATNNVAEYRALKLGVALAALMGATEAHFLSDSKLVVSQVNAWWAITDKELGRLHGVVTGMLMQLPRWSLTHIPRERNVYADMLVNTIMRPGDKRADRERALSNGGVPVFMEGKRLVDGFPSMPPPVVKRGNPEPFISHGP